MKLVNCWQPLKCLRYIHEVIIVVHSTIDNENVHLKKDHVDSKGILGLDRECGTGGPGGLGPHLFGIYLVKISKISKFLRIFFFLFSRAPHKKFASAHPG